MTVWVSRFLLGMKIYWSTRYTSSKVSPLNTALTGPIGNAAYKISTPFRLSNWETTIKRGDQVIATIQWKIFKNSMLTIDDKSYAIKDVFPRLKKAST
ncbi:hypothetical protein RhiXN_01141 [Rhizoctonia solani]|uniref:DUF6593 domain-containing protein n=1 Tax=Rhizoctonia solani TaxID=456999 RepID=A0A8H8NUF2_9AGAM|nr:uncharacterized protein RhiXN_01141 [Rhizoctonia solani]QRW19735.1 hypothetical protein RhiXN_01141 [Rhizoctonia solani]